MLISDATAHFLLLSSRSHSNLFFFFFVGSRSERKAGCVRRDKCSDSVGRKFRVVKLLGASLPARLAPLGPSSADILRRRGRSFRRADKKLFRLLEMKRKSTAAGLRRFFCSLAFAEEIGLFA